MSTSEKKIYLGKQGKVHGPFTRSEIEAFQENGEIQNFIFIWDDSSDKWNTLESPPPAPGGKTQSRRNTRWTEMKAICHDFAHLSSGTLEGVTEIGCEFLSQDDADYPCLAVKSVVILNLMDPKSEKSISLKARITSVERRKKTWIYRLSWKERPDI